MSPQALVMLPGEARVGLTELATLLTDIVDALDRIERERGDATPTGDRRR